MVVKKFLVCVLFFAFFSGFNFAQDLSFSRSSRIVCFFEFLDEANFNQEQRTLLYESFLLHIAKLQSYLKLIETDYPHEDYNSANKRKLITEELSGDAWLYIRIKGNVKNIQIDFSAFDIHQDKMLLARKETMEEISDFYFASRSIWVFMEHELEKQFDPLWKQDSQNQAQNPKRESAGNQNYSGDSPLSEIRIIGVPGTHVKGISDKDYIIPSKGEISIAVPYPKEYKLEFHHPEYIPLKKKLLSASQTLLLRLDQIKKPRMAFSLALQNLQFFSFNYIFHLPKRFFLSSSMGSYAFGWSFYSNTKKGQLQIISYPLHSFSLEAGYYFLEPGSLFSFYTSFGAALRFIINKENFRIDPVIPAYLLFKTGIDFSPQKRLRFFLEHCPRLYLVGNKNLLPAYRKNYYLPLNEQLPSFFQNSDLLIFQLGIRVQL